ncbi:hypothetical protein PMG11_11233 [Penicillium brasilianum]|uniref:Uncharacterized protein n=1 Tax=Penicillium brasilianum TaxID=104259 RepID=A0A0F7U5K4_PENBI|nr:hypothetical protein PMG11_11233 [Penicillium brasilianum]
MAESLDLATAVTIEGATQQIRQLENQVLELTTARETAETSLSLFRNHTKELTDQQKELESRFKTQDYPLSEFEEHLSNIHQNLRALAHAYFGELPFKDFCQTILRGNFQIFRIMPLTASAASKYLRVRAAETVIASAIYHS